MLTKWFLIQASENVKNFVNFWVGYSFIPHDRPRFGRLEQHFKKKSILGEPYFKIFEKHATVISLRELSVRNRKSKSAF